MPRRRHRERRKQTTWSSPWSGEDRAESWRLRSSGCLVVAACLLAPEAEEHRGRVRAEDRGRHRVGRHHEFPASLDHAAHTAPPVTCVRPVGGFSGSGGAISPRRRCAATCARSPTRPIQRKRIRKALMRSGQWKALETVCGVDCAWCSEFHHLTEKYTMGTSTNATMQATEDQTARFAGSSTNARKARMPPNAKTITAVVVSLGSQSHHTPQVGFAQMDPCMQRSRERTTPISMAASSRLSHFHAFVKRKQTAQTKAKVSASIAFQAVGTCTYMIRCTSPMKTSPGAC